MEINLELFRKNFWLINLVAAILGFVSVLTPSWGIISSEGTLGVFYFGAYFNAEPSGIQWRFLDEEPQMLAPGIIAMLILLVGTALILTSALLSRSGKSKEILSLIGGIALVIAPISLVLGMLPVYIGFWAYYWLSVGGIIPFIAGAFAIFSWVTVYRK
jgi:hypothetical protein